MFRSWVVVSLGSGGVLLIECRRVFFAGQWRQFAFMYFLEVLRFTVLDLMSAGVSPYAAENRRIDELRIHFQDGRCFIRRV